MDQFSKILVVMIASFVLLTGCGVTPQSTLSPSVGGTEQKTFVKTQSTVTPTVGGTAVNALVITQDMKDKSVSLKVGDTFEIRIPTIPTAGFDWQAKDLDTKILLQLGDPVFKADSNAASVGGIETLKFKVVGPGTTSLILLYVSPSKNGVPSIYTDSFGVTIEAK
jgi:predicted secreted protein